MNDSLHFAAYFAASTGAGACLNAATDNGYLGAFVICASVALYLLTLVRA